MNDVTQSLGSLENPIRCDGVQGEHDYLACLCGPGGVPITYAREGSVAGSPGHIYDLYAVSFAGSPDPIHLHFDMYAKGPREKRAPSGLCLITDFLKPKSWERLGYMQEVIRDRFHGIAPDLPDQYGYLYSKAASLLGRGPHVYAAMDFFHLPQQDWDLDGIVSCASQVVHELRGVNMDYPISVESVGVAEQFLATFHFKSDAPASQSPKTGVAFEVKAVHRVNATTIRLLFSRSS